MYLVVCCGDSIIGNINGNHLEEDLKRTSNRQNIEKSNLSLFQGFLVQLMNILLLAPVRNVESLNCDVEVVLHVTRI